MIVLGGSWLEPETYRKGSPRLAIAIPASQGQPVLKAISAWISWAVGKFREFKTNRAQNHEAFESRKPGFHAFAPISGANFGNSIMPVSAISASIAPAAATAQQDPQEPSPATEVQLESWAPKLKGSWDALGPLGVVSLGCLLSWKEAFKTIRLTRFSSWVACTTLRSVKYTALAGKHLKRGPNWKTTSRFKHQTHPRTKWPRTKMY